MTSTRARSRMWNICCWTAKSNFSPLRASLARSQPARTPCMYTIYTCAASVCLFFTLICKTSGAAAAAALRFVTGRGWRSAACLRQYAHAETSPNNEIEMREFFPFGDRLKSCPKTPLLRIRQRVSTAAGRWLPRENVDRARTQRLQRLQKDHYVHYCNTYTSVYNNVI